MNDNTPHIYDLQCVAIIHQEWTKTNNRYKGKAIKAVNTLNVWNIEKSIIIILKVVRVLKLQY